MKRAISRKNLWEATPRILKAGIEKMLAFIPPSRLLGRRFREQCRFLQEAQWWDAEQIHHYQLGELKRILTLAYRCSVYYRQAFDQVGFKPGDFKHLSDLVGLPTIDKTTVREHLSEMGAVSLQSSMVDYVSTGGTGGQPLYFYIGADRSAVEYAYLTSSWQRIGYELGDLMAVFRGRIVPPNRQGLRHEYDPMLRHHYYSTFHMTDGNVQRYLQHLSTLGPCFLHIYPSSGMALVQCIRRHNLRPPANLRGIIAESENVYPDQRAALEDVLGARFFSLYGHSEKLVLAAECEHSSEYHVWPTYGYFELLDEAGQPVTTPGQRGEIVGTGFINTVVPFVRYRTGDFATYVGDHCRSCGRQHTVIRSVEGRWPAGDLVACDGSLISMTALNVHDDTFARVRQFQFYQDTPGQAMLRVIPSEGWGEEHRDRILRSLNRKLDGRLDISIELTDAIPLSPQGKSVYVDQRILAR